MNPVNNNIIQSQSNNSTPPTSKNDLSSLVENTSSINNVTRQAVFSRSTDEKARASSLPDASTNNSERPRYLSLPTLNFVPKISFTDSDPKISFTDYDLSHFDTTELLYSEAFLKTANKYNVIIAIRTPSEVGKMLLEEGYPTKNFHVKAKSSPTGPTAGMVAADENFSKEKPEIQIKCIQHAIDEGSKKVDLILSKERIKYLLESQHIIQKEDATCEFSANYKHAGIVEFYIHENGAVFYKSNKKPVQVLTNAPLVNPGSGIVINDKPITADYDLFAIIPSKNQSENITPMTVKPSLKPGPLSAKNLGFLSNDSSSIDRDKGNISYFNSVVVDDINRNVKEYYKGGILVWHGDESNNPYSLGFNIQDRPIFIIPNTNKTIQVNSREEIEQLYKLFEDRGYTPPDSPRLAIPGRRGSSFSITDGTYRTRRESSLSDAGSSISRTSSIERLKAEAVNDRLLQVAKKMLDFGMTDDFIISVTSLNSNDLDNIREKQSD